MKNEREKYLHGQTDSSVLLLWKYFLPNLCFINQPNTAHCSEFIDLDGHLPPVGLEPTTLIHNEFWVRRLNHSATLSKRFCQKRIQYMKRLLNLSIILKLSGNYLANMAWNMKICHFKKIKITLKREKHSHKTFNFSNKR